MQKKIIALAVAGLVSSAAFAQTNVTVYGVADMYYANSRASGAQTQNSINSGGLSGSRVGFKGTEALGNGLSAVFTLEYGLAMDDKTAGVGSGAAARQSYVGLTGGFGTVVAGSLQTAGYDFACSTNPVGGSALDPLAKVGVSTLLSCGHAGRASNAAAYISPNFGGFTAAVNHGRVTEAANTFATGKDAYANLVTGVYNKGPVMANLTYSKISMANTAADDNLTEYGLGGSFDLKVVKLLGSYQTAKTGTAARNNKWQLSAAVPVGAGAVVAEYARNAIKSTAASDNSSSWMLAYTHSLSKRTTAYGGYTRVSNDSGAAAAAGFAAPTLGGNSSVIAGGVRHTF